MQEIQKENEIRSRPVSQCYLCGNLGSSLYENLEDHLFGVSGLWSLSRCSNKACDLFWLDPMPLEEDIGMAYASYYTHIEPPNRKESKARKFYELVQNCYLANKYGYFKEQIPKWKTFLGLLLYLNLIKKANTDFMVMKIPAQTGGYLLDVGCGSGEFLSKMQKLGWKVQGLDMDEKAAENARKKNINIKIGTLDKSGFEDCMFDVVVLSHVIEHTFDPISLLNECKRVLKPSGKIVIATPNCSSLCHRLFGKNWRGLEVPRHLMLFSQSNLEICANKAGFKTVEISSTERWAKNIYIASKIIKSENRASGKSLKDRVIGNIIQILEKGMQKIGIECGEETYYVGSKQ
jgi:2-polyprenyl-3-methyl-5-hydroxy-6-metoxy-1,4-benzoquinol methylase